MKSIGRCKKPVSPTTSEPEYDDADFEVLTAIERYKRINRRPWPSYCEILAIIVSLGYRKIAPAGPLPGYKEEECGR